jgi:hypothetical protein
MCRETTNKKSMQCDVSVGILVYVVFDIHLVGRDIVSHFPCRMAFSTFGLSFMAFTLKHHARYFHAQT